MTSCSRKRKAECVGPNCEWITGKGCKKTLKKPQRGLKRSISKRVNCSRNRKIDCKSPTCEWVTGKGCRRISPAEFKSPEDYSSLEHVHIPSLASEINRKYGKHVLTILKDNILGAPNEKLIIIKKLGTGSYGSVYIMSCPKFNRGNMFIIKFSKGTKEKLKEEIRMQDVFHRAKVGAPKVLFGQFIDSILVLGMSLDPFAIKYGTLSEIMEKQELSDDTIQNTVESIVRMIQKMQQSKLVHGDFHQGNIGFQQTTSQSRTVPYEFPLIQAGVVRTYLSPLVIDFGFSKDKVADIYLAAAVDIMQFIRCLHLAFIDTKYQRVWK
ncbi:MAG: hypothetical protein ACK518_02640, partial [bacterium]